jgi:Arc/MetJ-type ribon-helix-helix transcriptional regulator
MKNKTKRKQSYEQALPVNITLPPILHAEIENVCRKYAFSSFSDYVRARIRKDVGMDLST